MIRLQLTIIVILGILPSFVHSFFLIPLNNLISTTSSIQCFSQNNQTTSNGYQLCAIRIYTGIVITDTPSSSSVYDGIWYANTFRQLIKQCTGFSNTTDVGSGTCQPLMYEFYKTMILCICAEDLCNRDIDTCNSSVADTSTAVKLLDVMPDLSNNNVTCSQTNNASSTISTCSEHPFIFVPQCMAYIQNNSVLCAINVDNNQTTQEAWILQNYERYLMNDIHSLISMSSNRSLFNETANNAYYTYMNGTTDTVQGCICTTPNFCNTNINTCISQVIATANTTDWTVSTTAITTYTITGTSTSFLTGGSTTVSTASITSMSSLSSYSSTTTYTYQSTISSITSLSPEATQAPLVAIVTPSANANQPTQGESGLGSAASAGIACGIIFSALIITAEIVVFKFFFSSGPASSNIRAFHYRV